MGATVKCPRKGDNCILYIVEMPISATIVSENGDYSRQCGGLYRVLGIPLFIFNTKVKG